jgi:carbamoylphosphate synthase large subunit
MSKMPVVMVTATGGPAGLNTVRALQEARDCRIISADAEPFAPGLYLENIKPYVVPLAKQESYTAAVLKICKKENVDVVLPCSDEEVLVLSKCKELFSRREIALPISDHEVVEKASDRWKMSNAISKLNVRIPKTFSPSNKSQLGSAIEQIGFPLVIRPRQSRGARGVTYCKDQMAAELAFELLRQDYGPVIVQELVPGGPGSVFAVQTLWDSDHQLCASIVYQKLRERPPSGGVSWVGRTVHSDRLTDSAVSIMKKIGPWIGPAGVEFKVNSSDNEPYVMEINPRLQAPVVFLAKAGVNSAELWLRIALNEKVVPQFEYEERYFIRFSFDKVLDSKEVLSKF